jgi:pimeloyl-ACP methyl ester carboxylesterase
MLRSNSLRLALAVAALALPAANHAETLTFDPETCRLETEAAAAVFAHCAILTVPENPADPSGPAVNLFVARVAALTATPRPDPLVLIAGGPGQSTIDFYLQSRAAFEQARRDRDLILLDQRGTGRSAAGFECQLPEDFALDTAGTDALGAFVDRCLAMLAHDPRFYTTSVAVQDLDRLRAALGVTQWDVYGVSYGTRVALHYLRRFPERVHAAVLDGVVPPEVPLGPDIARQAQRALDRIFARCAADGDCHARFPDLPQHFQKLLERLESHPVTTDPAPGTEAAEAGIFGANELRAVVRFMSYNAATVALLPVLLDEAYDGNYDPLADQTSTLLRGLPEALSFPMSNAVVCTEDVPFAPPGADNGLADTYLGTAIVDALQRICARWPKGRIDPDFKEPVIADAPVLLLSGDNDPITPPAYAERVIADGLHNSVHVIGKSQGHGMIGVGCVPRLVRSFLEAPKAPLDSRCLDAEPPTPFFLTLLGPGP